MKGVKRKQIKKLILLLLIILISFNIIASNLFPAEAATNQVFSDGMGNYSPGMTPEQEEKVQNILNGGNSEESGNGTTASSGLEAELEKGGTIFKGDNALSTLLEGVASILTILLRLLLVIGGELLQIIATAIASISGESVDVLTIEDILFNKIAVTDINFFNLDGAGSALRVLRELIAGWYYTLRNLSVVILLCVLVYLGIRMALSTVASEKATYKKMLTDWLVSFGIIFIIHYIILLTINVSNGLVSIMANAQSTQMAQSGMQYESYMEELKNIALGWKFFEGWGGAVMYVMLCVAIFGYLFVYIKRMVTIGFLILIAPIITITYSIDKIKDGKSQALDTWVKEFGYNVLIQPFDALIYIIFVSSAINITGAGLGGLVLAIIMLTFRRQALDIVKSMFGFSSSSTLGKEIVGTAAAMSVIKSAGKFAGKKISGVNGKKMPKMKDGNYGGYNFGSNQESGGSQGSGSGRETGGSQGSGSGQGTGESQSSGSGQGTGGSQDSRSGQGTGGSQGSRSGQGTGGGQGSGSGQGTGGGQGSGSGKKTGNDQNSGSRDSNPILNNNNQNNPTHSKLQDALDKAKGVGKAYAKANVVAAGTLFGAAVGFAQGDLSQGVTGAMVGYHGQKAARVAAGNFRLKQRLKNNEEVFDNAYTNYQKSNGFDAQEMEQRTDALMDMKREQILNSDKLDDETKAYGMAVHDMYDSYGAMGMKKKEAKERLMNTVTNVQNSNEKTERRKQETEAKKQQKQEKRKIRRQKKQK